jgi:tetratricopeptide (TPR) repeat protein
MGVVLRGHSTSGDVAIKVLLRADSRKQLARFDREKRLLASLGEDAGFVPLLESGDSPQGPYIVMPFLGGGTLRDRLRRGALPLGETVALATTLAKAIARAHEAGIVHRDLKPENVIFTNDGRPLVTDLGLAKHFRHDEPDAKSISLSRSGMAIGTFGYMAPEQMKNAKAAGPAVDVFALGAIVHECLSGAPPFHAENLLQLVEVVEHGKYDPLPKHVPDWLAAIVRRALEVDPDDRFKDGSELARALERGAVPRGRRWLVGVVSLGGLAVGALVLALARRPAPGTPGPEIAPVVTDATAAAIEEKPGKKELGLLETAKSAAAAGKKEEAYDAYMDLGDKALEKDHPRLAVEAYGEALKLAWTRDEEVSACSQLGFAEMHTGSFESSLRHTRRAIELSPKDANLRNNAGYTLHVLGRDGEALTEFGRCLELDPQIHLARMSLGVVARLAGDGVRALEAHRTLLDAAEDGAILDPGGVWYFNFESKVFRARGAGVSLRTEAERLALVRIELAIDEAFAGNQGKADGWIDSLREHAEAADLETSSQKAQDDLERLLEVHPDLARLAKVRDRIAALRK